MYFDLQREEEVIVYAHQKSSFTDSIEQLCNGDFQLVGYKEGNAVWLELLDIYCFIIENNKIFAVLENDKFQLKQRLYKIEEILGEDFIKINQSCIANIKKIKSFNADISGTLAVTFKNGYKDFVSRRNIKSVKERLGL